MDQTISQEIDNSLQKFKDDMAAAYRSRLYAHYKPYDVRLILKSVRIELKLIGISEEVLNKMTCQDRSILLAILICLQMWKTYGGEYASLVV